MTRVNAPPDAVPRPFPKTLPEIDPAWLTSTVVAIARGVQREAAWETLPVLADALQDAGCENAEILEHLRGLTRMPRLCHCRAGRTGTPSPACSYCEGSGYYVAYYLSHSVEHRPSKSPTDPLGGCWCGTCWVVQALLNESQAVRAMFQNEADLSWWYDVPVVNAGNWWGMTWLLVYEVCHGPLGWIVESDNPQNAQEALSESEEYGHHVRVEPDEDDEFENYHYDGQGQMYDAQNIMIHGREGRYSGGYPPLPFPCVYVGPGLPPEGLDPRRYHDRGECEGCGKLCYPVNEHPHYRRGTYCSEACYIVVKSGGEDEPEEEAAPAKLRMPEEVVAEWLHELGVTPEQLLQAVTEVNDGSLQDRAFLPPVPEEGEPGDPQ